MKTILVVDDDPVVLFYYRKKLEPAGFSVITAADGQQSIELLQKGLKPDAMILDYNLSNPTITGQDIAKLAREMPELKDIPIMLVTSHQNLKPLVEIIQQSNVRVEVYQKVNTPIKELIDNINLQIEIAEGKKWIQTHPLTGSYL